MSFVVFKVSVAVSANIYFHPVVARLPQIRLMALSQVRTNQPCANEKTARLATAFAGSTARHSGCPAGITLNDRAIMRGLDCQAIRAKARFCQLIKGLLTFLFLLSPLIHRLELLKFSGSMINPFLYRHK
jgi:hypothetical protein